MNNKAYYIVVEDDIILTKKEYNHWREIQDEYYDKFKSSLGPWTYEELISYLKDDFNDENKWPFTKEHLIDFFKGNEIIHHADNNMLTSKGVMFR